MSPDEMLVWAVWLMLAVLVSGIPLMLPAQL